jgi:hypothetical protein
MMETYKRPIRNKISLFNDNSPTKKKIVNDRKCHSNNNLNILKYKKKFKPQKLCNPIDFIKQKKKFFIENSFDVRGTREFLASKEVAMRIIKLNDEIKPENEDRIISKTNKDLEYLNYLNGYENENYEEIKKKTKTVRKNTMSPRKSRKGHHKKMNKEFNLEIKEISKKKTKKMKKSSKKTKDKSNDVENKFDSSALDSNSNKSEEKKNVINDKLSNDSHQNVYRFFIDNANEPEDNFQKKLKKELKKVENLKPSKDKNKNGRLKRKSLSRKDLEYKRPNRMNNVSTEKKREVQSIFMFSEINKKLMVNDDLELSSIDENNKNIQSPTNNKVNKKNINKNYASIQMNNKKIKERIQERMSYDSKEEKENIYKTTSKLEINSDKESIISILSDLM